MQSEIQTANIVKILRFAQNDKSEIFRMTLKNYDRPSVFRPCEFADEKFRTIFLILVISVHEDVILVSECIYRAMTYTGKLLVTLGYSRSSFNPAISTDFSCSTGTFFHTQTDSTVQNINNRMTGIAPWF